MTDQELLDMFACAAMQGMVSNMGKRMLGYEAGKMTADNAYYLAEQMLAERKKRYGNNV